MPLPANFSGSEHLQDLFRRYMNRQVRDFFIDLGGENWEPEISTPRGALRIGCTHLDSDSLSMTLLRWELFQHVRSLKFQQPFYGIPVADYHQNYRFQPQVQLYFQEDEGDVEPGYAPVTGQISLRLMDHTNSTINPGVAQTIANRINTEFATGGGYIWRKGKDMVSYYDKERGYRFRILCRTLGDGRELITKLLDVNNDVPDWSNSNHSENQEPAQAFPTIPDLEFVYGESIRMPRRRPVANCRFQYAVLNIYGRQNPIPLVDRSGIWPNALTG
jgi:hypothetical protein